MNYLPELASNYDPPDLSLPLQMWATGTQLNQISFFLIYFDSTWIWTQGLTLARQVLLQIEPLHPGIKDLNGRSGTLKLLQGNTWDIRAGNYFLNRTPIALGNKSKNWQIRWYQIKKLLHIKENNCRNEQTVYRIGENLCQIFIR
jgi:hypothetical protein